MSGPNPPSHDPRDAVSRYRESAGDRGVPGVHVERDTDSRPYRTESGSRVDGSDPGVGKPTAGDHVSSNVYCNRCGASCSPMRLCQCCRKRHDIEPPGAAQKAPLEHLGDIGRALTALAYQLEHGATRPGRKRGDWALAYAEHRRMELLGKAARHLLARMGGQILDEHGRAHATAAAADLMLFVELEARP